MFFARTKDSLGIHFYRPTSIKVSRPFFSSDHKLSNFSFSTTQAVLICLMTVQFRLMDQ